MDDEWLELPVETGEESRKDNEDDGVKDELLGWVHNVETKGDFILVVP